MRILSFGEILLDQGEGFSLAGGAPFNFAAHAAALGADVSLLSAVGKDEDGQSLLERVAKEGIDTSLLQQNDLPTGKCLVRLQEGIPSYTLLENVAYDAIEMPENPLQGSFDLLACGSLALRSQKNKETLAKLLDAKIADFLFADLNLRAPFYHKETVAFLTEKADCLKISLEELPEAARLLNLPAQKEAFAQELKKTYPTKLLLLTCGEAGAYAFDFVREVTYFVPAAKTVVVSSVGAGDSFSAAFLAVYAKTRAIETALSFAAEISALVVAQQSALPSEKTRAVKVPDGVRK